MARSMADREMMEPKAGRSREAKILVLWTAAIALLIVAALVSWAVVIPVMQARRAVAPIPPDDAPDHAAACAEAIRKLGGESDAARKLDRYLQMPARIAPDKTAAVCALAATGQAGIPAMLRNMDHPSMEVSSAVLWKMCQGHPSARQAIGRLGRVAQGPEDLLAYSAILALGKIGPEARDSVPALIACLKHEDATRRRYAAQSLGLIGDKRAIEPLKAAAADREEAVKDAAEEALKGLRAP
jgi:HEAT repeat protein